jgi:LacI family transcriptional regulator
MAHRVTLKTIADKTGYSVTTVSRALANYDDVSASTRQVIQQTAQELGYYPNHTARQLQKQQTDTIGLIIPSVGPRFADPYFSLILSGIGDGLAERGYDLLISTSPPGPTELEAYRYMVEGRRADGLLVIRTRREDERIAYLAEQNFPFVAFGRTDLQVDYPYIDEDGEAGTYELVMHLIGLGHSRIAYIAAPQDLTFGYFRHKGYQRALHDTSLTYDPELVQTADLTRRGGEAAAAQLLRQTPRPTAIVAANDLIALGALNVIHELGLTVGRDVSVAGFDDIPPAEVVSLTTLNQPIYEIGHELSHMLMTLIKGEALAERQVLLVPELIVRDSVGPPG